jgi:hypothetical protein
MHKKKHFENIKQASKQTNRKTFIYFFKQKTINLENGNF